MTISKALERADQLSPNTIKRKMKIDWLSELDGLILKEIILKHEHAPEDEIFQGYTSAMRLRRGSAVGLSSRTVVRSGFSLAVCLFREFFGRLYMAIRAIYGLMVSMPSTAFSTCLRLYAFLNICLAWCFTAFTTRAFLRSSKRIM